MSEIDRLLDGAPEYNPDAAKKPKAMAAAPRSESDELLKDAPSQARGFGGWRAAGCGSQRCRTDSDQVSALQVDP